MSLTSALPQTIRVAVVGNPNTGKSTLFTALAGVRQRVGNYPGVTVEKKTGQLRHGDQTFELIDLPGTYSLAPRSPDEMVAVDVLLGRRDNDGPPDVVLSIVDASNLERNLFLVSQVLAIGLPMVVALNMVDLARAKGLTIDVERLRQRLGLPVVEVQAAGAKDLGREVELLFPVAYDGASEESLRPFVHLARHLLGNLREHGSALDGQLEVALVVQGHCRDLAERVLAVEHPAVGAREERVGHVANAVFD